MKSFSLTDTGITREMNQDYFFASENAVGNLPNLFLVADGMGGHKAGDYASRYTTERIAAFAARCREKDPQTILHMAIHRANTLLVAESNEDPSKRGMGTTLVAATIIGQKLLLANVGDSRLYMIGDEITQITRDHSLVEEMVRMGEIRPEEARLHPDKNIITRAIGAIDSVEPDFYEVNLTGNPCILICSDGLTNMVPDEEILEIVKGEGTLEEKGHLLVNTANRNGGKDNITVMLISPFVD